MEKPHTDPLFMRFLNREVTVADMLLTFSRSEDTITARAANERLTNPPDLYEFHQELSGAVRDIAKYGVGAEFRAFVNHYMEKSITEDLLTEKSPYGENSSRIARVKNPDEPWVQGLICYNVCLYIKAYGLENLKICKVCDKLFLHKGKWAVYCSDACKEKGKNLGKEPARAPKNVDPFNPFRSV